MFTGKPSNTALNYRLKHYLVFLALFPAAGRGQAQEEAFADSIVYYRDSLTAAADTGSYAGEEEYQYTAPKDRHINDVVWDSLCSDPAFGYRTTKEQELKPKKAPGYWMKLVTSLFHFFSSGIGVWLFWTTVLLLFGYILYRVLRGELSFLLHRKDSREDTGTVADESISEEDLLRSDWEQRLQQALIQDNKRLATRFALMHILQLMQQAEYISYRIDKTNHEYYLELREEQLRQPFHNLLLRYEFAWFGRFAITETAWADTLAIYQQLKTQTAGK